jgi:hypothetical protein
LAAVLDAHPRVGLAYSHVWITDSDGRRLYKKQYWNRPEHWAGDYINDGRDECRDYLYLHCTIPTASSALMRRRLFEEVGPFDVSLRLAADWLLYARMLERSDIAFIADPLVDFRTHPATSRSTAAQSLRQIDDSYWVTAYIAKAARLDHTRLKRVRERMSEMFTDALLCGVGMNDRTALRAAFDNARRLDPCIRGRIFRQLLVRAPLGGLRRRCARGLAISAKMAIQEILGRDAVDYVQRYVREWRGSPAAT